jgi:large subunit ribosomal protein L15
LIENGLASRNTLVKILGRGTVDVKVTVKAHAFSKSAIAAIEAKGGSTETIS